MTQRRGRYAKIGRRFESDEPTGDRNQRVVVHRVTQQQFELPQQRGVGPREGTFGRSGFRAHSHGPIRIFAEFLQAIDRTLQACKSHRAVEFDREIARARLVVDFAGAQTRKKTVVMFDHVTGVSPDGRTEAGSDRFAIMPFVECGDERASLIEE